METVGEHSEDPPIDSDVPAPPRAARQRASWVRDRWDILLMISAGGALGSLARWLVAETVVSSPLHAPWATAVENVSGAFALGALMVFVLDVWPSHRYLRPFLGVGVLGGYTTFSTYMLDTRTLLVDGHAPVALAYLFGTLLLGLVSVTAGVLLARVVVRIAERRRRRQRGRQLTDPVDSSMDVPEPDLDDPTARSS